MASWKVSISVVATIVCATGCVAPMRPVMLPDGQQGYALKCSGTHHDFGDCMNEAAEACHGPYQILEENGEHVGSVAMATPMGNGVGAVGVHAIHRTMIVECGASAAQPTASSR